MSEKVLLSGRLLPQTGSSSLSANIERLVQVRGIATLFLAKSRDMPGRKRVRTLHYSFAAVWSGRLKSLKVPTHQGRCKAVGSPSSFARHEMTHNALHRSGESSGQAPERSVQMKTGTVVGSDLATKVQRHGDEVGHTYEHERFQDAFQSKRGLVYDLNVHAPRRWGIRNE